MLKKLLIIQLVILVSLAFMHQKVPSYSGYKTTPQDDLVTDLEGDGTLGTVSYALSWYSGMLDVSNFVEGMNEDYKMHYWFFPSQSDPAKDPVLLWLNGGPGCSSLLGALTEHGPFIYPQNSTQNVKNSWSWNNRASVLYLESPPGVGFSTTSNYTFSDNLTAALNLAAVRAFFDRFDAYKNLDFFISGESYAGIYVPTLAYWIDQYNLNTTKTGPNINLKGFAVGNGATYPTEVPSLCYNPDLKNYLQPFVIQFNYEQGIISQDLYSAYKLNCFPTPGLPCNDTINEIAKLSEGLNIYNIDGFCYPNNGQKVELEADFLYKKMNERPLKLTPPCADAKGALQFLNNDTVKSKLHLSDSKIVFDMCNDKINENFQSYNGSYYLYPYLIGTNKYRIYIYSGDIDAAVPWTTWYVKMPGISTPQQGGTYWKMDGLTFIRFKGAGHMVPTDDGPGASLMINSFLYDESMPIIIE